MSHAQIDAARLLGDLHRLRQFGPYRTGVHRPPYTEVDMASRRWLMDRMRQAGLEPEIDGIGNVIGRGPAPDGRRLLLGSHLETQNEAGWLDGALGVLIGLEVARTLGQGIDVAAFADEEGHYGRFHGCRSFVGDLPDSEIDAARNKFHGLPLREALAAAGLAGLPRLRATPGSIWAIWRRISNRAPSSTIPATASASSPRSSATGATGSPPRASRTMRAPRA